tara:strand:- start:223 stop:507 length:285 start_codon:yes stop_codon:yes gene_type:complete
MLYNFYFKNINTTPIGISVGYSTKLNKVIITKSANKLLKINDIINFINNIEVKYVRDVKDILKKNNNLNIIIGRDINPLFENVYNNDIDLLEYI